MSYISNTIYKFSKVSWLLNLLYELTVELTFEKCYQAASGRSRQNRLYHLYEVCVSVGVGVLCVCEREKE